MRLLLPPTYAQRFHFISVSEDGLFELAGEGNVPFPPNARCKAWTQYFDTQDGLYRQNGFELTSSDLSAGGLLSSGKEVQLYTTENRWQTQSSRLLGERHPTGIAHTFVEFSDSELNASTDIIEATAFFDERLLCTNDGVDIGVQKTIIRESGLLYLSFCQTTAGINFPLEDYSAQKDVEFQRRNYTGMLAFIDQAVNAGLIAPLLETPHDSLVRVRQATLKA